jgi:hypothetical protein|nr:MAG TPA: holin [Caudoviricetes sp.]
MLSKILEAFASPVSGVIDSIATWFKTRQEIKRAETDSKLRILEAKANATVELYKSGVVGDIAWENTAQQNAGWKDEYWTLIISAPFLLVWIPGMEEYIHKGFEAFELMPDWYQMAVGVAVSAAFGFKKFAEIMSLKNGVNVSRIEDLRKINEYIKESSEK